MACPLGEPKPKHPWVDVDRRRKLEYRRRKVASGAGQFADCGLPRQFGADIVLGLPLC